MTARSNAAASIQLFGFFWQQKLGEQAHSQPVVRARECLPE